MLRSPGFPFVRHRRQAARRNGPETDEASRGHCLGARQISFQKTYQPHYQERQGWHSARNVHTEILPYQPPAGVKNNKRGESAEAVSNSNMLRACAIQYIIYCILYNICAAYTSGPMCITSGRFLWDLQSMCFYLYEHLLINLQSTTL